MSTLATRFDLSPRPAKENTAESVAQRAELQRQQSLLVNQEHRLLDLRSSAEVDQQTCAKKRTELRDRLASIKLQLDVFDGSHDEMTDFGAKVFELSQTLCDTWIRADYATKRRTLDANRPSIRS